MEKIKYTPEEKHWIAGILSGRLIPSTTMEMVGKFPGLMKYEYLGIINQISDYPISSTLLAKNLYRCIKYNLLDSDGKKPARYYPTKEYFRLKKLIDEI